MSARNYRGNHDALRTGCCSEGPASALVVDEVSHVATATLAGFERRLHRLECCSLLPRHIDAMENLWMGR